MEKNVNTGRRLLKLLLIAAVMAVMLGTVCVALADTRIARIEVTNWTKKYDGEPILPQVTAYSAEGDELQVDKLYFIDSLGRQVNNITNVSDSVKGLTIKCHAKGDNADDYFVQKGYSVIITYRSITVTTESKTYEYDGDSHACVQYSISGDGFVDGEGISIPEAGFTQVVHAAETPVYNNFTYTGTGKAAGKITEGDDTTGNYHLIRDLGELTVTPKEVTVKVKALDKTYNAATDVTLDSCFAGKKYQLDGVIDAAKPYISLNDDPVATTEDKNVGSAKTVNVTLSELQSSDGNYLVTDYVLNSEAIVNTIAVNPADIEIIAYVSDKEYDGTAEMQMGTPKLSGLLPVGADNQHVDKVTITVGTATAESNVKIGKVNVNFTGFGISGEDAGNYNLKGQPASKKATINPLELVATAGSAEKMYDGTALTCETVTFNKALPTAISYKVTMTAASLQKDVGNHPNIIAKIQFATDDGKVVVPSSCIITYPVEGELKVTKRPITLVSATDSFVYDAEKHYNKNITVASGSYAEGEEFEYVSFLGFDQANEGETDHLNNNQFDVRDVTKGAIQTKAANYEITKNFGTITITKRPVTVNFTIPSREYDGTTNITNVTEVKLENVVSGDTNFVKLSNYSLRFNNKYAAPEKEVIAELGVLTNLDTQISTVYKNYKISETEPYTYNKVAITKVKLEIAAKATSKIFDGTDTMEAEAFIVEGENGTDKIVKNEEVSVDNTATQGRANTIHANDVNVTVSGYTLTGTDAANYEVGNATCICNSSIQKYSFNMVAPSATKVYDATPLTAAYDYPAVVLPGTCAIIRGTLPQEGVQINGTITDAGEEANVIRTESVKITLDGKADGEDVTDSFNITYVPGKLTVTKRPLTLTSASDLTLVYNAEAQSVKTVTAVNYVEGELLDYVNFPEIENVLDSRNNKAENNSFLAINSATAKVDNYDIKYIFGTIKVNPKPLTAVFTVKEKTYDGTAKLPEGADAVTYELEGIELKDKDSVKLENYKLVLQCVNAGTQDVVVSNKGTLTSEVTNNEPHPHTNYTLANAYSKPITIQQKVLTPVVTISNKVYDATKEFTFAAKLDANEVITDDEVSINAANAHAYAEDSMAEQNKSVSITGLVLEGANAANYKLQLGTYTATITRFPVTFTANSATKVYDGTPLTETGSTMNKTLPGSPVVTVTTSGSITDAGTGNNIISGWTITDAGSNDLSTCFDVTEVSGSLTVTPRPITLESASLTVVYDGEKHVQDIVVDATASESGKGYVNGQVLTYNSFTEFTQANDYEAPHYNNTFTVADNDATGAKVANYKISYVYGTVLIMQKSVDVVFHVAEKVYDGTTELKTITFDLKGIVPADQAEVTLKNYKLSIADKNVGEKAVTVVNKGILASEVSTQKPLAFKNYKLNEVTAENMTILKKEITPIVTAADKVYDANDVMSFTARVNPNNVVTGDKVAVKAGVGSAIAETSKAGQNLKVTISGLELEGTDSGNYSIKDNTTTATITRFPVTITADDATKVYDGTALTKNGYSLSAALPGNPVVIVTTSGSITDAGTIDNTISGWTITDAGSNDLSTCFKVTEVSGKLTVTPRPITLKSADLTEEYDGEKHVQDNVVDATASESGKGYVDGQIFTYASFKEFTQANDYEAPHYNNTFTVADNDATDAKVANYKISYVYGTVKITQKPVDVVFHVAEQVYDGTTALKTITYDLKGIIPADQEEVTLKNYKLSIADKNVGEKAVTVVEKGTLASEVSTQKPLAFKNYKLNDVTAENMTILKKDITPIVTAADKVYDANALMSFTAKVHPGDVATGDKVAVKTGVGSAIAETSMAGQNLKVTISGLELEGADSGNYSIKDNTTTATIKPFPVTITADDATKVYDGKALTKNGYSLSAALPGEPIVTVVTTGTITNVGTGNNEVTSVKITDAALKDLMDCFDITYEKGALTVTQRAVTLTSGDLAPVDYDGKAHSMKTVTVSGEGYADGEEFTYASFTEITKANNYKDHANNNKFVAVSSSTADVNNYKITYVYGTITVDQLNVNATIKPQSRAYNGETAVAINEITLSGVLAGDKENIKLIDTKIALESADISKEGSNEVMVLEDGRLASVNGDDTYLNYHLAKVNAQNVTLTPLDVTVKATAVSQPFNGDNVIDNKTVTIESGVLAADKSKVDVDITDAVAKADGIYVGEHTVTVTGAKLSGDKAINYRIVNTPICKANITPCDVTVYFDAITKVYDGKAVDIPAEKFHVSPLPTGLTVTATATNNLVDVGKETIKAEYTFKLNGKEISADNFNLVQSFGSTIEVTPAALTVVLGSAEVDYDGTYHTKYDYTITSGALVSGHKLNITYTGRIKDAGEVKNSYSAFHIVDSNSKEYTSNYNVHITDGTIKVNKLNVTLKSATATKKYDGTPISNGEIQIISSQKIPEGESFLINFDNKNMTDAGVKTNSFIWGYLNDAKKENYNVSTEFGTLTITKRYVCLTSQANTKKYDGDAIDNLPIIVEGDGFAAGEGVNYLNRISFTDVGNARNSFDFEPTAKTNLDNYEIRKDDDQYLYITAREIHLSTDSNKKVYDGTPVDSGEVIITGDGFALGEGIEFHNRPVVTDATDDPVANSFSYLLTGRAKACNYIITIDAIGTLAVDKATVVMTSGSFSKKYDGTDLDNGEITITGDGFAYGEGVIFTDRIVLHDAVEEEVPNSFTYTLKTNTKASNYIIKVNPFGTLKVDKRVVSLASSSYNKLYDGEVLDCGEITITGDGFAPNEGVYIKDRIHVYNATDGELDNSFTYEWYAGTNSANYIIKSVSFGKLSIAKRSVILSTPSASKTYDGTAIDSGKVEISGQGFAKNEGIETYNRTVLTNIGTATNEIVYTLKANTNPKNYVITTVPGKLTVTPRKLSLVSDSASKVYDGVALTKNTYVITEGSVADGQQLKVSFSGSLLNAGTVKNSISEAVVLDKSGKDVTANYNLSTSAGTLTVSRRTVVMTSATAEKIYDGTPLVCTVVDETGDGFAQGEGAYYDVTGSQLEIGHSKNTFTYELDEFTKADNYEITVFEGDLYVYKIRDLVLTNPGYTGIYDGNYHGEACKCNDSFATIKYYVDGVEYDEYPTFKYPVYAEVVAVATKDGCTEATLKYIINIDYRVVVVSCCDFSKHLGEKDPLFYATVQNALPEQPAEFSFQREEGEYIGEYAIHVVADKHQNGYEILTESGTMTILPKLVPDLKRISLNQTKLELVVGERFKLSAKTVPAAASARFVWRTSNTKVATVAQNGRVIARGRGVCTITVRDVNTDIKARCHIVVR